MLCPYCSNPEIKVVDKRASTDNCTRRRRECLKCSKRFTTYEQIELIDFSVIKKDGRCEPFNREKLQAGIEKACEKRPVTQDQIEKLVSQIESQLRRRAKTEIPSKTIGEMVIKKLQKLDKVAYLRFASVYKQFKDISDFHQEIVNLKKA